MVLLGRWLVAPSVFASISCLFWLGQKYTSGTVKRRCPFVVMFNATWASSKLFRQQILCAVVHQKAHVSERGSRQSRLPHIFENTMSWLLDRHNTHTIVAATASVAIRNHCALSSLPEAIAEPQGSQLLPQPLHPYSRIPPGGHTQHAPFQGPPLDNMVSQPQSGHHVPNGFYPQPQPPAYQMEPPITHTGYGNGDVPSTPFEPVPEGTIMQSDSRGDFPFRASSQILGYGQGSDFVQGFIHPATTNGQSIHYGARHLPPPHQVNRYRRPMSAEDTGYHRPHWGHDSRHTQQNSHQYSNQFQTHAYPHGAGFLPFPVRPPEGDLPPTSAMQLPRIYPRQPSAPPPAHNSNPAISRQIEELRSQVKRLLPTNLPEKTCIVCDICAKDYSLVDVYPSEEGEIAIQLPCGHYFGEWCIFEWKQNNVPNVPSRVGGRCGFVDERESSIRLGGSAESAMALPGSGASISRSGIHSADAEGIST
ncbi:hypothetical protein CC86DRAFT_379298 [Ophiobolus disseminans]|uniref:Uncharacterized protein n=1 Tax=Ophiobolus disseminans TaxID=1469910 RepID=A0A6A7AAB3_9PLEO|nr:hypothetical protein CC86DRAFT_379298 [Ophiobolus disseminans]